MDEKSELSYKGLKGMKKNDFAKVFKKPASWKKASAILFLAKYKFSNGKINLVAVPYKKYNEAAKVFKEEVKRESTYTAKLTMLTSLEQKKDAKGNVTFKVTPTQGSMNLDFLQTYAAELFGKLKVGIEVVGSEGKMDGEDLQEVVEVASETLSSKKTEKIVAKQAQRAAKARKIQEHISKFEKAMGKVATPKLEESLAKMQQVYKQIKTEAMADGNVDNQEKDELQRLEETLKEKAATVQAVHDITINATKIKEALAFISKS